MGDYVENASSFAPKSREMAVGCSIVRDVRVASTTFTAETQSSRGDSQRVESFSRRTSAARLCASAVRFCIVSHSGVVRFRRLANHRARRLWQVAGLASLLIVAGMLLMWRTAEAGAPPIAASSTAVAAIPALAVEVTSPANNTTYLAPADFVIEATASGESINDVEFFLNSASLGRDTSEPYSWPVSNLSAGAYVLTAVVTNAAGQGHTSDPVTITVTSTSAPPTVSLITPIVNAFYISPANITLAAEASDSDGSIDRIEFYNGSMLIGTATDAPYSVEWFVTEAARVYTLTAKAYDDEGQMATSSPIGIAVTPPASATDVPDTDYEVPADSSKVRFVDADATSDGIIGDDTTGDGTEAKPYRTLSKAVASSVAGGTIVFRQGIHRITDSTRVAITKRLSLQPFPHERVWITGSDDISGRNWVQDGTAYRLDGWTAQFPTLTTDAPDVDSRYPLASNRDMLFINGQPLVQIGTTFIFTNPSNPAQRFVYSRCDGVAIRPGTFCVDYDADRLYIGDSPVNQLVEATVTDRVIRLESGSTDSAIRGLGFAHFAEAPVRILANPARTPIEKNVFIWNGINGLRSFGSDMQIRDNIFNYNGRGGFRGSGMSRMVLERNTISYNNTERFRSNNDADGAKMVNGDRMVIRNNLITNNYAHALWLDGSVTNATVVNNRVLDNQEIGIFFEISRGVIIAGNVSARNGSAGIQISGSSKARIYNNTLVSNRQAVEIKDTNRVNATNELTATTDPRTLDAQVAAGIDWETRDVVVKNNIFSNATTTTDPRAMVNVYDGPCGSVPRTPTRDANGFVIRAACNDAEPEGTYATLDYNAYYRAHAEQPINIARWMPQALTDSPDDRYPTLDAFRSATGNEQNGIAIDNGVTNPFFVGEAVGDYRLKTNSSAINAGQPLPDTAEWTAPNGSPVSVASVLGIEPGVTVNLGALDESVLRLPISVTQGGFRYNRATGRYVQIVKIENTGTATLQGPVSLVLDSLSGNVVLANSTGSTNVAYPSGSPYINVNIGDDLVFAPHETATVMLEFINESNEAISYTTRIIAGSDNR